MVLGTEFQIWCMPGKHPNNSSLFFFKFCSLFCCYCCCFGGLFCFVALDRVSCNPSCPQTCWVVKAGLGLLTLRTISSVLLWINHSVSKFLKLNKMQLTNLFLEDYKLLLWGIHRVLSRSRILYGGQLDGSVGKGDDHQAFWPEFHARSTHGGSRNPISSSGLQSAHMLCYIHLHISAYLNPPLLSLWHLPATYVQSPFLLSESLRIKVSLD